MTTLLNRSLTGLLAATTLATTLAASGFAGSAAAQVRVQQRPLGPAGVLAGALPDIIPTNLGMAVSGFVPWGGTTVIDQPNQVDATQAGPQKNLCHLPMVAYRTFNKGDGDAGAFVTKTYRDATLVRTHNVAGGLAAKDFIDWHQFPIDLKEGMNIIRVEFDTNKQVAETDEKNTYTVRVDVKLDCDGDGKIKGVPGGLKQAPNKPHPDPVPPRSLRLKSTQ